MLNQQRDLGKPGHESERVTPPRVEGYTISIDDLHRRLGLPAGCIITGIKGFDPQKRTVWIGVATNEPVSTSRPTPGQPGQLNQRGR